MGPTLTVVRNEVDLNRTFHCEALSSQFPGARDVDFPAGERPDLDRTDGVVLSGSTAGVYERESRPWIAEQERLVRELVDREIPTLGVCFGHQVANAALGGTVEAAEETVRPVAADLGPDPLFEGVSPPVPVSHGDVVAEPGDGMRVIGSADYYSAFATRHCEAPLWTVQFHPEYTADLRERLVSAFGWTGGFDDVDAARVCENFRRIVAERADGE